MIRQWRAHLIGAVGLLVGLIGILALVAIISGGKFSDPPEKQLRSVTFASAPPPEKPKTTPPNKPRPPLRPKAAPPANLAPQFSSALAGIAFSSISDNLDFANLDERVLGNTSNVVMTADAVDTPPRAVRRAQFSYPDVARRDGVTGYVTLSVLIDTAGHVVEARVVDSKPKGIFDAIAISGIRGWQFDPARYKGATVRVWAQQRIRFELN